MAFDVTGLGALFEFGGIVQANHPSDRLGLLFNSGASGVQSMYFTATYLIL